MTVRGLPALLLLGLASLEAEAQIRVQVEPVVGVYAGFSSIPRTIPLFEIPRPDTVVQGTGVALGGKLTIWPSRRLGFRASVLTASSEVGPAHRNFISGPSEPARVTTAALEVVLPIRELQGNAHVYLAGGPALVARSGEFYEDLEDVRDLGLSLGLGSGVRLTDRLHLTGDFRMLLYSLDLSAPDDVEYPSAFQTDLLAHIGVGLMLGAREDEE